MKFAPPPHTQVVFFNRGVVASAFPRRDASKNYMNRVNRGHRFVIWSVAIFFAAALIVSGQTEKSDETIRVETNLVTVPVIVSDRDNRYIAGLKAADFEIVRDTTKEKIEFFAAEEEPINVALLLDTSRSTEMVLDPIQDAAKEFVKQLRPRDRAMVATFDFEVNVLTPLTEDRGKLKKAIGDAEIGARFGTVLNDAIFETVTRHLSGFKGRKAVILLTDGKDAGSRIGRAALIDRLREADVLVYSIFYETGPMMNRRGFGSRFPRGDREMRIPERRRQRIERNNEQAMGFLNELATATAGRVFEKKVGDLDDAFKSIANELRHQYLLGFYPEGVTAGTNYRLKVTVGRRDSVVRAKTSFRIRQ